MPKFKARSVQDRIVQYPARYILKEAATGETLNIVDLAPAPGEVYAEGTKINRAFQQPVEDWLANTPAETPAKGGIPIAPDGERDIGYWKNCVELKASENCRLGSGVIWDGDGVKPLGVNYGIKPKAIAQAFEYYVNYCGEGPVDGTYYAYSQYPVDGSQNDRKNFTLYLIKADEAEGTQTVLAQKSIILPFNNLACKLDYVAAVKSGDYGLLCFKTGDYNVDPRDPIIYGSYYIWPFNAGEASIGSFAASPVSFDTQDIFKVARSADLSAAGKFLLYSKTAARLIGVSASLAVSWTEVTISQFGLPTLHWLSQTRAIIIGKTGTSSAPYISAQLVDISSSALSLIGQRSSVLLTASASGLESLRLSSGTLVVFWESTSSDYISSMAAYSIAPNLADDTIIFTKTNRTFRVTDCSMLTFSDDTFAVVSYKISSGSEASYTQYRLDGGTITSVAGPTVVYNGYNKRYIVTTVKGAPNMLIADTLNAYTSNAIYLYIFTAGSGGDMIGFAVEDIAKNDSGLVAVAPGKINGLSLPAGKLMYLMHDCVFSALPPYDSAKPVGIRLSASQLLFTGKA